jgi:hypothetical protein
VSEWTVPVGGAQLRLDRGQGEGNCVQREAEPAETDGGRHRAGATEVKGHTGEGGGWQPESSTCGRGFNDCRSSAKGGVATVQVETRSPEPGCVCPACSASASMPLCLYAYMPLCLYGQCSVDAVCKRNVQSYPYNVFPIPLNYCKAGR